MKFLNFAFLGIVSRLIEHINKYHMIFEFSIQHVVKVNLKEQVQNVYLNVNFMQYIHLKFFHMSAEWIGEMVLMLDMPS